jgi:hypothetical protein
MYQFVEKICIAVYRIQCLFIWQALDILLPRLRLGADMMMKLEMIKMSSQGMWADGERLMPPEIKSRIVKMYCVCFGFVILTAIWGIFG